VKTRFSLSVAFLGLILSSYVALGQAPVGCGNWETDTPDCADGCFGSLPYPEAYIYEGCGTTGIVTGTLGCSPSQTGATCTGKPGTCPTCQSMPGIPMAVPNDACDPSACDGGGGGSDPDCCTCDDGSCSKDCCTDVIKSKASAASLRKVQASTVKTSACSGKISVPRYFFNPYVLDAQTAQKQLDEIR
jgi:hypothetical protein